MTMQITIEYNKFDETFIAKFDRKNWDDFLITSNNIPDLLDTIKEIMIKNDFKKFFEIDNELKIKKVCDKYDVCEIFGTYSCFYCEKNIMNKEK